MVIQALLEQAFAFVKWIISWLPVVSLPTIDLSPVYAVMATASAIVPVSAIMIGVGLALSVWAVRGIMLAVRWLLVALRLLRG